MSDCLQPWWPGLTCDHLYPDCPNRTRAEKSLRRYGWWDGSDDLFTLDPHGGDVCGLCLHRHNQTRHRADHRTESEEAS